MLHRMKSRATILDRARALPPAAAAAFLISAVSAATLMGAWYFEFVLGIAPCPLCLLQRIPHYVVIPVALALGLSARERRSGPFVRIGLVAIALVLLAGSGLGVYHAGIEWRWWAGPTSCTGDALRAPADILSSLKGARVVPCDEAPWRFLGLSLAGYNALIAGALAAFALFAARRSAQGSSSVSQ
jgi:disulfide bond formation protein DsbB